MKFDDDLRTPLTTGHRMSHDPSQRCTAADPAGLS
jgi:hypothetical protein